MEKIKSIMEIQKLGLPFPETIFIFDYKKQEKEIEEFLKNRKRVMIRTDKHGALECPHKLDCPKEEAKEIIKKFISNGYAVILSEYVPMTWKEDGGRLIPTGENGARFSGNILFLEEKIIVEIMRGNPLTLLARHGIVDEHILLDKYTLKEIFHWGERIIDRKTLERIIEMLNGIDLMYKIVEFGVGDDWIYFWQIKEDKTSKILESIL